MAIQAINDNDCGPRWNVLGFLDDDQSRWGQENYGYPVLGGRELLQQCTDAAILAVPGNPSNFRGRRDVIESLGVSGERFATIVDPSVRLAAGASLGRNTSCMANVVISFAARVGDSCVILPNTVIAHHATVGSYCLIGSNVTISSSCVVGENCYIGSGTAVRDNISIGSGALIGLGACIVKDVPSGAVVAGNPGRPFNVSDSY